MANQDKESINARIKREMDKETKGMSPKEKEEFRKKAFPKPKPFNPKPTDKNLYKPIPFKASRGRKAMRGAD